MLTAPIGKTLKDMTIPMVMGMIALMSFNLVDTFFISLLGTHELAAISFTFPVTFTVISLNIGLGIGTSAVIAKTIGQKHYHLAKDQATTALIVAVLLVAALSTIGWFIIDPLFKLLGSDDNTQPFVIAYMKIWYFSSVFLVIPMVGNAILRASGDTKTPSMVMALGGAINAMLDPILIFGIGSFEGWGIEGAAIASLIAWMIGAATMLYLLSNRRQLIDLAVPKSSAFVQATKTILKIGLPAAGANMLTPIAMSILTAIVATYGHEAVAAFGVGSRIESIACMLVLALSMTLPPFISQNLGASQHGRVQLAYKLCCKFVLLWQLGVFILLAIFAPIIASAFAQEVEVQQTIQTFMWIVPLGYGLQGIVILTNSSFNALHLPSTALKLSVLRLFVFYVPCAYIGGLMFGILGLFIGCVVGNILMAGVSYVSFNRYFRTVEV
ncbi:MATE efflux family protein [Catenovulum agarivorans DS-2]|uniref:MATE efflux family protein n=1 Tax=Catenovulum agarivorans DS-2 TaxID=1328313 RepID=W7QQ21_9ALTE|nr:MATE family efflux transporter [Catenovulum agarivorans]EWH11062.1 MATE efflux family protein [Catenovulum agarivorans DS-2]